MSSPAEIHLSGNLFVYEKSGACCQQDTTNNRAPLRVIRPRAVIRRGRREASPMLRDGCTCVSCCTHPEHTFAHIMLPFMPRTCAEQLHFKITDFAARFVRKHARQVTLPTRVAVADTNPKFLHHTLLYVPSPLTASILSCETNRFFASIILQKKCMAPKRAERFEL